MASTYVLVCRSEPKDEPKRAQKVYQSPEWRARVNSPPKSLKYRAQSENLGMSNRTGNQIINEVKGWEIDMVLGEQM